MFVFIAFLSKAQPVASYVVKGDTNLSPVRVCQQYITTFKSISTGGIASVSWSFATGNPSTSTNTTVNVLWNSNGNKSCSLTVTDTNGVSNTISFTVIVANSTPNVSFGALADKCSSDPAFPLYGGVPAGGTYFGPGVNSTTNKFSPGVADTGYHTIGYAYTAPNGCTDTAFSTIYVKKGPNASLLELNSFSNCNGFSFANPNFLIEMYDQSTGDSIINYELIWGDGTLSWDSTAFRPGIQHTYSGQGIYQLKFVVTGLNGCTDTAKYLVVNTTNPASLNLSNPGGTNGCAPVTITLPVTTTNTDTTISYTIDWGDGTDTTFKHPPPSFVTHTYDTTSCIKPGGFFNITSTATNACVSTTSTIQGPFVTQKGKADFAVFPGCVGVPKSFNNMSIPGFTNACSRLSTYIWDFGDGSPPVTQIVNTPLPPPGVHTYNAPGYYNVTLILYSTGGSCPGDTLMQQVCIENPLTAIASITDTIGCQPVVPILTNTSDTNQFCSPAQYGWFVDTAFGWTTTQGTTPNDYLPTFEFTEPGIYTLSFFNVNNCGGDTISQKIHVWDKPDISFLQNLQPYCDSVTIFTANNPNHTPSINANGTPITSFLWRITPSVPFLLGTDSTTQYPIFRLPPGTYNISLIATNQCGSDTATQTVQVNNLTNGGFTSSTLVGCSPLTVNVQSTSTIGVQHGWYLDTVFYSSARDTTFYLQNTGVTDSVVKITLLAYSGPGCADTIVQYVTIYPLPTVKFGATEVCVGNATQFNDSSIAAAAPIFAWSWNFGDGNSSTLPNPSHTYANPGLYPVMLIVKDTNECEVTYLDSVWVRSLPLGAYNMLYSSVPDSACIQDSIFFNNTSTVDSNGTPIVSWEWDIFNDGTVDDTLQNTAFVFQNPGSFPVKLTVTSASNCSYSIIDTIHVSRPPEPFFTLSSYGGCTPVTVVATELSSGYITSYNWVFYTLDSNQNRIIEYVSTQQNPNPIPPFQANILSTKAVFAELTTSNACYTKTYTDTINIKPIPIPFFMFSSDTGCSPLSVIIQVDGLATGNPDSILFTFGDGSPNLLLYPNVNILPNGDTLFTWNQQAHTFSYTGNGLDTTYYVTLFASNECGDSSYTVPINVKNRSVQSFFTASANVGCAPLNVSFFDYSFAATSISYCFDFDTITKSCNGNIFFGRNVTYPYTQYGTYVVAQFALNTCGMDTSYQIIDVRPRPNVQFSFVSPTCSNDSTYFVNNTTLAAGNILGYKWDFGDGDSSFFTNASHLYMPGTYNVCLTVYTDAGCDSTYCQTITVNSKPTANFTFQNFVCQNAQPIQFLNSSTNPTGNIISYEWFFGDGNLSTQINPQHIYMNPGVYDVKLRIINDNFCKDSLIQQITIFAVPEAAFSSVYMSNDSCGEPQTINFTNNSNNAGGYYWDFDYLNNPGQDTSILIHPNHVYTKPGTFRVMLIAKNGLGCQDTAFKTINVHPIPEPQFTVDLSAGCAPLTVNFSNLTKLPAGFNDSIYYTWTFSDGTVINSATPRHTFVNPGTYSIQLKARSEYSCLDSIQYNGLITVYPVPAPQFTSSLLEFGKYKYNSFVSSGTPPFTYYWDFGDGKTANGPDPTHTFDVDKVGWEQGFRVCLTVVDANNCDSTWCDTIVLGAFTLYVPNAMAPDSDGEEALFLPKGQGLESYTCRIFDRWGNMLWESSKLDEITASPVEGWDGLYNGQPVPSGVYIWRIDATFANGVIWRGQQYDKSENSTSGTITILR